MTIESNIPLPSNRNPWKHLDDMKPGDSVFDEGAKKADTASSLAYSAMVVRAKKYGWKISGRTVDGGVRIWRIK